MASPKVTRPRIAASVARHPLIVDTTVGAFVAMLYVLSVQIGSDNSPDPGRALELWDGVAAVATFGLITFRRRAPRAMLTASVLAAIAGTVAGEAGTAPLAAAAIAAYTVASVHTRRDAWLYGGGAAALLYAASFAWPDSAWPGASWWERGNVNAFAGIGLAMAIGDAVRTHRAYVIAVENRARRAEESREAEAHRRVMEERLRIARELHDVVAHNLALISVQAGVAGHLMTSRPEKAAAALVHARQAANRAVQELGTVLAVLRENGDPESPTEPPPGLSQLPHLLETMAAAGLRVSFRQRGIVRDTPAAVDLAAYRIIQESLTNAHKHASTRSAYLCVCHAEDRLTIDVTNRFGEPVDGNDTGTPTGTRHGLIGMRERAAAVGGTLHAGPSGSDTFAVHVVIPVNDPPGAAQ